MIYAATVDHYLVKGGAPSETRTMKMSALVDIHQGDFLFWNTTVATPMTAATDGVTFCGVMLGSLLTGAKVPTGSMGDVAQPNQPVIVKGVVTPYGANGETYTHGLKVEMGTIDCQSIVLGSTHPVGTVYLPDGSSITVSGTTTKVPVLIDVTASITPALA